MDNTLKKNLELRKALVEVDRLTAKIVHLESYIEKKIKSIKKDTEWLIETFNGGDPIEHWDTSSRLVRNINNNNKQIEECQEILKLIK